jgi:hypothetical protein
MINVYWEHYSYYYWIALFEVHQLTITFKYVDKTYIHRGYQI